MYLFHFAILTGIVAHLDRYACSQELGVNWEKLDGLSPVQCDVIFDKMLWCVDENDRIFRQQLDTQDIEEIGGRLKYISAGLSGVWGTNSKNQVWYLKGSYGNPTITADWQRVDGSLEKVAAGQDIVVGIDTDGNVFRRDGNRASIPLSNYSIASLGNSGSHGAVAIIRIDGLASRKLSDRQKGFHIFKFAGISESNPTGTEWKPLEGEGTCFQVDIYKTNDLWCLREKNEIFRYDWSSKTWSPVNGALVFISTGPAGVWGVNQVQGTYYRSGTTGATDQSGSSWKYFSQKLVSLSVGNNIVVGVSEDKHVWITPRIPEVEPEAPCQW